MRLFWPLRERSPSTDSECSTASQSSLASDASFYSAAGEAEMETDVAPSLPGETGVVSSRSAPSRPGDPILDLTRIHWGTH
uniref:Uncharacterized protein n=1 Tax=Globisporangium ultimum (strain ATCC 200006 / CBS 805.95 / DAOM BR144) TaxID=431595 RepID=K3XCF5_GLOUD